MGNQAAESCSAVGHLGLGHTVGVHGYFPQTAIARKVMYKPTPTWLCVPRDHGRKKYSLLDSAVKVH